MHFKHWVRAFIPLALVVLMQSPGWGAEGNSKPAVPAGGKYPGVNQGQTRKAEALERVREKLLKMEKLIEKTRADIQELQQWLDGKLIPAYEKLQSFHVHHQEQAARWTAQAATLAQRQAAAIIIPPWPAAPPCPRVPGAGGISPAPP